MKLIPGGWAEENAPGLAGCVACNLTHLSGVPVHNKSEFVALMRTYGIMFGLDSNLASSEDYGCIVWNAGLTESWHE